MIPHTDLIRMESIAEIWTEVRRRAATGRMLPFARLHHKRDYPPALTATLCSIYRVYGVSLCGSGPRRLLTTSYRLLCCLCIP